ncbi:MAG: hypothetical protein GY859_37450 [Desulfobacterales bacterium]|nr:hypothetical protein [Desulfobacterales bacterium]
MKCPICGFENMTGVSTCGRCGALLRLDDSVGRGDFVPPRASGFKSLRSLGYLVNRMRDRSGSEGHPGKGDASPSMKFVGRRVMFSCLPGLGHLVDGGTWRGLAAFGVWLILLCLTVNFYGGALGTFMGALVILWHWAVLIDASRAHRRVEKFRDRLFITLIFFGVCCFAYVSISRLAARHVDFVVSPFNIQTMDIRTGDSLLIRPASSISFAELARGDILTMRKRWLAGARVDLLIRPQTLVRVLAEAGDQVHLSSSGVEVNGVPVEAGDLPEGDLPFPQNPFSLTVPDDRVLVICPLRVGGGRRLEILMARDALCRRLWTQGLLVGESDVRGRASGVYLPVSRRHFW